MNYKAKLAVFLFALIVISAAAIATAMPSQLTFHEKYEIVSFPVENTTNSNQYLNVDVYAPLNYEVVYLPEWIAAGETANIELKLIPIDNLTGSSYSSTFVFSIGTQKIEQEVMLKFEKLNSNPFEISAVKTSANDAEKILVEITAENQSILDSDLKLDRIDDMPADWTFKLQEEIAREVGIKVVKLPCDDIPSWLGDESCA